MAATIPSSLDDITPDWLTGALRASGVIGEDAEIDTVSAVVLGTGEGFAGDLARLTVTYGHGTGPATMVAKIPTSIDDNRRGSEMLGVYEREIRMYQELLPELDLPVPQLYYADVDPNPDWEKQMEAIRRAEKLPIWLLRFLAWVLRRFVKPEPRASVLILEDLDGAEIGDQVSGASLERVGAVLDVAARMHARTWGERVPEAGPWLQSGGLAPKLFQASYLGMRKAFLKGAGRRVSAHMRAMLDRLRRDGLERGRRIHTDLPQCLVHGDLRLDNIFFAGDDVRALIDWQLTRTGPGVVDVAYFIAGSLGSEVDEDVITGLLTRYHAGLVEHGVTDYPLERLFADYEDGLLSVLGGLTAVEQLDMGDDRGLALVESMVTRLDARLTRVPA
ncbi:MAG: phosphotransferase [Acidimicrobiales bacterium]|nr:phosphotransferase [Acidimicrobiales bacterium]